MVQREKSATIKQYTVNIDFFYFFIYPHSPIRWTQAAFQPFIQWLFPLLLKLFRCVDCLPITFSYN